MKKYTRPDLILKNENEDTVGIYRYEYQALEAAQQQGVGTYTLIRPTGTYEGGSGPLGPTEAIPTAPSGLTATAVTSTSISLGWVDNSNNELNFIVERSADGTTGWTVVKTVPALGILTTDSALTALTQYFYRVKATNATGDSAYSNVANTTTLTATAPSVDIPTAIRNEIEGTFTVPAQDADGWTILTPNVATQVYYIDFVNGDDSTATPYAYNAFPDMQEPTMAGLVTYKTLEGAWENQSGDKWFLLRGGTDHTFAPTQNPNKEIPSGLSNTERLVIAGYDIAANGMPRIPYQPNGVMKYWYGTNYTTIMGIDFHSRQRDPDHAEFVGFDLEDTIPHGLTASGSDASGRNIDNHIEGCKFMYAKCTLSAMDSMIVRRNTFCGNYSTTDHAQGLWAGGCQVLLEENIFDQTGWYKQSYVSYNDKAEGQATIFNHNTYFAACDHCHFVGNIFSRPSSIGTKFTADSTTLDPVASSVDTVKVSHMLIENNFYVDCEVHTSMGGNTDFNTGPRWEHMYYLDNAGLDAGESQQTNRSLGWNVEAKDWKTGAVTGNVMRGTGNNGVINNFGLAVEGHCSDVAISGNVFYDIGAWDAERTDVPIRFIQSVTDITYTASNDDPMTNIVFDSNYIQNPNSLVESLSSTCVSGVDFTNNSFFDSSNDTTRAYRTVLSGDLDFATWNTEVGGTNTLGLVTFTDPTRDQATYMGLIGGTATKQGFIDAIRAQSIDNWDANLTGAPIAAYIKAGFTPA